MKMGELEQRTGVNRETIRVLIRKGLVPAPEKPKATVAHYTEEHVQAIRAIRSLQHEHQVTLDQIGSMLRGDHLGKRVEAPAFQHLEELVLARFGEDNRKIPLSTLLQTNPNADRDARGLAALGAIDLEGTGDGTAVSYTDASLISIWGRMRDNGFDESASFYPEILDHYTRAANYLAYAEASRFLARVEGFIDEDKAADMIKKGLPLMLDFFGVLRMKYFLRYIAAGSDSTSTMEPPQLVRESGPGHSRKSAARKARDVAGR